MRFLNWLTWFVAWVPRRREKIPDDFRRMMREAEKHPDKYQFVMLTDEDLHRELFRASDCNPDVTK